jgi:hypothetical protein
VSPAQSGEDEAVASSAGRKASSRSSATVTSTTIRESSQRRYGLQLVGMALDAVEQRRCRPCWLPGAEQRPAVVGSGLRNKLLVRSVGMSRAAL